MRCDSRDRVSAVIGHRPVDRVPRGELCIDDAVVERELGCIGVGFEERVEFVRRLGLDIICLSPVYPDPGAISASGDILWEDLHRWVEDTPLFSFAVLDGVFGWGMRVLGFKEFFTLPARSPSSLTDLIKRVENLNAELAGHLAGAGINGIILADDIAYNKGLIISPGIMRKFFIPSLARQFEGIARLGIPVFFHSDGNYEEIIPDLIRIGFHGLHCLDRNAGMDVRQLQHRFGERLCLWGTLGAEDLTASSDPVYLEKLLEEIRQLNAGKGFILGTNSGLYKGIELDRLTEIYRGVD